MSNGDDKVVGALEMAADTVWEREAARRALLANLGLIPMISRFDAVGAMPAKPICCPHSRARQRPFGSERGTGCGNQRNCQRLRAAR
jgi:hypothetical protein